ncbi:FAD/NAD(P)-binding domain-containing protein [Sistotremastrum suecicum HHB10207 ss-3]|uniref:FAD/NAD(P)-binding domain-containing protein n=1 Tax=Sistotremastrum suecicum HHB10207 ss-3 TaxID=1314776 RepID=A0A165ZEH7_9AGAM|nr:FAD/NAD(P)-binding domain-containing protein [Sistotremastrum suecicum HHB10207 ss-3]
MPSSPQSSQASAYPPAPLPLSIIIIGCGLGGLAAAHTLASSGHKVTILEAAEKIGEVGAGIQVTPNVVRLLLRWGLGEELERVAVEPEAVVFRRYENGEIVGRTKWGENMRKEFGVPYYHIHRADYHTMLSRLALSHPHVTLRLSSLVTSHTSHPTTPSITLSSGEVLSADLIIGADGIKSLTRNIVVGRKDQASPTGDAAYRATISAEKMMEDEELRGLIERPEMTAWMGPRRHIMGYCIRGRREYNLVMLHPARDAVFAPSTLPSNNPSNPSSDSSEATGDSFKNKAEQRKAEKAREESWTAKGSVEEMRAEFADFEPRIKKMLSFIPSTLVWKLFDRAPLPNWIHPSSPIVLIGDACHPMLPYRAQGAAMAIEDAAVLGVLLSRISSKAQLRPLLQAYFELRVGRTSETQKSSRLNQWIFHLEDGEEQRERDRQMRKAMEDDEAEEREGNIVGKGGNEGNMNQWADKRKNGEQFGYDAEEVGKRWWREHGGALARL